MNALIIGLYGIFVFMVGISGNSESLLKEVKQDAPGFLPWALSIGVLAVLNEFPQTEKIVAPFIGLLILAFVLRNFETLKKQFNDLSSMAQNAVTN